jgi:hypothetical protein
MLKVKENTLVPVNNVYIKITSHVININIQKKLSFLSLALNDVSDCSE